MKTNILFYEDGLRSSTSRDYCYHTVLEGCTKCFVSCYHRHHIQWQYCSNCFVSCFHLLSPRCCFAAVVCGVMVIIELEGVGSHARQRHEQWRFCPLLTPIEYNRFNPLFGDAMQTGSHSSHVKRDVAVHFIDALPRAETGPTADRGSVRARLLKHDWSVDRFRREQAWNNVGPIHVFSNKGGFLGVAL